MACNSKLATDAEQSAAYHIAHSTNPKFCRSLSPENMWHDEILGRKTRLAARLPAYGEQADMNKS
jgi:hypothetical protein